MNDNVVRVRPKPQRTFLARLAIVELLEELKSPASDDTLGYLAEQGVSRDDLVAVCEFAVDVVEAYGLAVDDLERAREVMEEDTAFKHFVAKLQVDAPESSRSQLQKAARALVADPALRAQAVREAGLYESMGLEP